MAGFLRTQLVGHLAIVTPSGPHALPMMYAYDSGRILLHGSTGSGSALGTGAGTPASFTVTSIDGVVLARSALHHSMNFRCAMLHGTLRRVDGEAEKRAAFDALLEATVPGRSGQTRPADARELAATAVLVLEVQEASYKVRAAGVNDDPADLTSPWWAGVVPVRQVRGEPQPAADLAPGVTAPATLADCWPRP